MCTLRTISCLVLAGALVSIATPDLAADLWGEKGRTVIPVPLCIEGREDCPIVLYGCDSCRATDGAITHEEFEKTVREQEAKAREHRSDRAGSCVTRPDGSLYCEQRLPKGR